MEIDGNKPAPKTRYRETSDFFYSQPVTFTDKNVNFDLEVNGWTMAGTRSI